MSQTQSNAMPLPMAEPCQSRRQKEAFDGHSHSCHSSKNPQIRCVDMCSIEVLVPGQYRVLTDLTGSGLPKNLEIELTKSAKT